MISLYIRCVKQCRTLLLRADTAVTGGHNNSNQNQTCFIKHTGGDIATRDTLLGSFPKNVDERIRPASLWRPPQGCFVYQ